MKVVGLHDTTAETGDHPLTTACDIDNTETLCSSSMSGISEISKLSRFSSLKKLLRVTSYVLKFVRNCRAANHTSLEENI